jgi:integrase
LIRAYQDARKTEGVSGRTVSIEVTLIRQVLNRAKRWSVIADEVSNMPENQNVVGRVLTREQKIHLFRTAASKPEWDVTYCAAVIAVNTTCRKVELLTARWADVDLFTRAFSVQRSKTEAGHRLIPLNDEWPHSPGYDGGLKCWAVARRITSYSPPARTASLI